MCDYVCHSVLMLFIYLFCGVGMSDELEKCVWDVCFTFDVISQNYAPTQVCRKTASQHGYVVKLWPNTGMS